MTTQNRQKSNAKIKKKDNKQIKRSYRSAFGNKEAFNFNVLACIGMGGCNSEMGLVSEIQIQNHDSHIHTDMSSQQFNVSYCIFIIHWPNRTCAQFFECVMLTQYQLHQDPSSSSQSSMYWTCTNKTEKLIWTCYVTMSYTQIVNANTVNDSTHVLVVTNSPLLWHINYIT